MRTPRLIILILFFAASTFLVLRSLTAAARASASALPSSVPRRTSRLSSFFSWNTPFTLFPPNAAISLTDDNSTSFPARPAAFGPALPAKGLSGQLWIGSGFADDNLQEGEGEGELGCSDLPDWDDGGSETVQKLSTKVIKGPGKDGALGGKHSHSSRSVDASEHVERSADSGSTDDGTDDYLHAGRTNLPKVVNVAGSSGAAHADIQSLQEAAEIAGKVVLLSRGGCGFLEKVKWAQRRGAKAVIVGDNRKGGPLIQMFARGDTSNVSIPSVFTSRTTAHLLSSLMQPGSFIEDSIDENGHPVLKVQHSDRSKSKKQKLQAAQKEAPADASARAAEQSRAQPSKKSVDEAARAVDSDKSSWISRLFRWGKRSSSVEQRNRPPSSGELDWVIVDEWNDEKDKMIADSLGKAASKSGSGNDDKDGSDSRQGSDDNFQIGVQDWRDPDLMDTPEPGPEAGKDASSYPDDPSAKIATDYDGKPPPISGPKGGSITPGSGEYDPNAGSSGGAGGEASRGGSHDSASGGQGGIISKLFGDDDASADNSQNDMADAQSQSRPAEDGTAPGFDAPEREGLWVTITPTNATSSFLDTLLVLVISPLITLSVVYALLVLRARIRRRRWRAPKSVVDRLPVRTYHTVTSSPSHSSRLPSPTSTSPTTPLLQHQPPSPSPTPGARRSRPRSRTTTGVLESENFLTVSDPLGRMSRSPPRSRADLKKVPSRPISSEWKKFMGRQVECAVCLEEYVDGVSRVMSLPCGHEFHADCITPWLTTRRRTCPICKSDVVRSLARASPSSPRYENPYLDDSGDDNLEASGSGNTGAADSDMEQGILASGSRRTRRGNRARGWRRYFNSLLGRTAHSEPEEDPHLT